MICFFSLLPTALISLPFHIELLISGNETEMHSSYLQKTKIYYIPFVLINKQYFNQLKFYLQQKADEINCLTRWFIINIELCHT